MHTHTHVPTHTHATHISKLKEIEITHTLAKWGSVSRKNKNLNKKKKKKIFKRRGFFSAGVDSADTRENPRGKNRVMTVAPSLFGVSWHKECRTKNKLLDFCPLRFSWFPYVFTVVAQFISVCVPALVSFRVAFQRSKEVEWVWMRWHVMRWGHVALKRFSRNMMLREAPL